MSSTTKPKSKPKPANFLFVLEEAEAERIRAESTKADLWDDPGTAWGAWKLGLGLGV